MQNSSAETWQLVALQTLGERVRALRAQRGLTRKALAHTAQVSERHLANLEGGSGNASYIVLMQIAAALRCSVAELMGDMSASSPEWLLLRDLLSGRNEAELRQVRLAAHEVLLGGQAARQHTEIIALIGLRGAGKSTLGRGLADALGYRFVELSREIERLAACSVHEIHALLGNAAYRRYERSALEEVLHGAGQVVMATPGGLVSDAGSFALLLSGSFTVWLRAKPREHLQRVIAQGDLRPMQGQPQALEDLQRILDARGQFYAKADLTFDTSGLGVEQSHAGLMDVLKTSSYLCG